MLNLSRFDRSVLVSHLEEIRDICIRALAAVKDGETVNVHHAASSFEHSASQLRMLDMDENKIIARKEAV